MRQKPIIKWLLVTAALLILYGGTETTLMWNNHVTLYASAKRIIAGAPVIQINGHDWAYVDTVEENPKFLEVYQNKETSQRSLYKAAGTPSNPPFVFVKKEGNLYYKYKYPQSFYLHGV